MFLLRDGSFTLMKIASLMFLAILLFSFPTILKLSRDTSWPVVFWWSMIGDGALIGSLNLSPKVLPLFNVLFFTIYPSTSVPVYHPTFLEYGVPVLGMYQ